MNNQNKKDLDSAYCFIVDVSEKQGRIPNINDIDLLYGDGTRWSSLTKEGFRIALDQAIEDIKIKWDEQFNSNI